MHVIGDLEGRLHVLYNILVNKLGVLVERGTETVGRCQSKCFEWVGGPDVYVVQCGDQLDAAGNRNSTPRHEKIYNYDIETLMFTDYLQEISKGKFINIIGNHEWFNMQHEFIGVHKENSLAVSDDERMKLFNFRTGLLAHIIRRRCFICRINNALFSHGGLCAEALKYRPDDGNKLPPGETRAPSEFIASVNGMLDDEFYATKLGMQQYFTGKAYIDAGHPTEHLNEVTKSALQRGPFFWKSVYGNGEDDDDAIMTNRRYDFNSLVKMETMKMVNELLPTPDGATIIQQLKSTYPGITNDDIIKQLIRKYKLTVQTLVTTGQAPLTVVDWENVLPFKLLSDEDGKVNLNVTGHNKSEHLMHYAYTDNPDKKMTYEKIDDVVENMGMDPSQMHVLVVDCLYQQLDKDDNPVEATDFKFATLTSSAPDGTFVKCSVHDATCDNEKCALMKDADELKNDYLTCTID